MSKHIEVIQSIQLLLADLEQQITYKENYDIVYEKALKKAKKDNPDAYWYNVDMPNAYKHGPISQTAIRRRATVVRELLLQLYEEEEDNE